MPLSTTSPSPSSPLLALLLALVLLGGLAVAGWPVVQQVFIAPSSVPQALVDTPKYTPRETRTARLTAEAPGPRWSELNTPQKLALYPLAERWAMMSEAQKRRWLAIAQTFGQLPAEEQDKLHSRMTEWASLSAQQRSQARLNYATTKRLAPDDKRAQWEAYLALSDEERKELAAKATPRPQGAATAIRPIPPKKLARVPAATAAEGTARNLPKIPPVIDHHPRPALPAPAPLQPSAVETRPVSEPAVVETTPINIPSAEAAPLPPLPPPTDADTPASTSDHSSAHHQNLYPQR